MRVPCALLTVLLFHCLCSLQEVGAKKEKQAGKRGKIKFPTSGEFITKDSHACTWEISGDEEISLLVICPQQDNNYWCKYTGQPHQCLSYNTRTSQYWKQILGKLKKKKNACEDKTLKSRICKRGPTEAHLRLVEKSFSSGKEERGKSKASGRKKDSEKTAVESKDELVNTGVSEKRGKTGKRKSKPYPTSAKQAEATTSPAGEVNDDDSEFNEDLAEAYCAEKWHSLCSFFVNLWNG
ncbi:fibroblast growth factor-binding protein 3 [Latimeria chalumnae]|nr:PREDICTED: fibroblast growth factor-binding protein 3 [Latimeria chalumnae]|eukprot:XP_005991629.1 PREDICTED: fibroblast growth factor-binding protein 3 [Latimeria chalumnae]